MARPPWADEDLSVLLPDMRAAGEHHCHEFKEQFPAQGHELAKEFAAFATSGGGLILIGVRDDGTVAGSNDCDRDHFLLRAQGIAGQVQPRSRVDVTNCYDEGFILAILVRQDQVEPVYYYDHRPYIRDGSCSRPATPNEVKERIWSHSSSVHRKRMEDLNYEIAKNHVEQTEKRIAEWDALALRSSANYQELLMRTRL